MKSGKNNVKTFKNILNNFDTVLIHYYSTGEQQKHILAKTEKTGRGCPMKYFSAMKYFSSQQPHEHKLTL